MSKRHRTDEEVLSLSFEQQNNLPKTTLERLKAETIIKMPLSIFDKLSEKRKLEIDEDYRRLLREIRDEAFRFDEEFEANEARNRAELAGDGDDSESRWLLELSKETGLDVLQLMNEVSVAGLREFTLAAIRKRKPDKGNPSCLNVPASFRNNGAINGEPLTAEFLKDRYLISGATLTREGEKHRLKISRAYVYEWKFVSKIANAKG